MNVTVSAPTPPSSLWLSLVWGLLLAGGVIWYSIFLGQNVAPYAGGSDSSGYFNSARILKDGELLTKPRQLPELSLPPLRDAAYVPLGFSMRKDGFMVPTYPTGYPLQLIATSAAGLDVAPVILNVITALGCGVLLFLYCRKLGLRPCLALGGVALLWICPLFIFSALQPMSDLSAVFWSLAVLYPALLVRENWKYSLVCGAALGIAVLVRPTDVLLVIPVLVAFGFQFRLWLCAVAAGLPCAVFLGYYNWHVYGSPWTIGYTGISEIMATRFAPHNLAYFAHWIPVLLSPLALLACLAPLTALARQKGMLMLASWAVALIGFYAFYYHSGEYWWYLRFILPAFPAFIAGALIVAETISREHRARPALKGLLLLMLLVFGVSWEQQQTRLLEVTKAKGREGNYRDAARWTKENLPANSVILCMQVSGALFYYTDFALLRWDEIDASKYGALLDALSKGNRPIYAALFNFETAAAQKKIGGHWAKRVTTGQVTVWQWQP